MQRGAAEADFASARGASAPARKCRLVCIGRFLFSNLLMVHILPYNPTNPRSSNRDPTPVYGDTLSDSAFPSRGALTIAFAHVAYRAADEFAARGTGVAHFEVRTLEELERRAREADVLVVSGLWRNALMTNASKLRF